MKSLYLIIAIVLIVAVIGYLGRNQIKTMFVGTPTPVPSTTTTTTTTTIAPNPSPSSAATSSALINTSSNSTKGSFLVGPDGMTLYIFDKDKPGMSACSGTCAALWPPYTTAQIPSSLPTNVGTIKRADGTIQFTYKGLPIYYYTPDQKPDDVTGDGVGGIWHLVKP